MCEHTTTTTTTTTTSRNNNNNNNNNNNDNNNNCHVANFAVVADHRVKMKESQKINKPWGGETMEYEGVSDTKSNCRTRNSPKKFRKETRRHRDLRN